MYLKTDGDRAAVERACLDGGFLGLGWGFKWDRSAAPRTRTITWERYITWAESIWPGRDTGNLWRFHDAEGLVWTHTADGIYYLAQFTGPWEYRGGPKHDLLDLSNIRPARIEQIGSEAEVPGAVVRRFSRQGQAFCAVHDESAARYSALIWARLTGESYEWRPTLNSVLDSLLSPFDVQDLVAAYLQAERGWLLFPSRLSDSTAAYEFVLRDPTTGRQYAVQVKTGESEIDQTSLVRAADLTGWVIFSTTGAYRGRRPRHVEQLDRGSLLRFMTDRRSALPPIVDTWLSASSEPA
jgi:hypothetical protein